jgi:hypothetical protein
LDGLIKIQAKVDQNAEKANEELEEAKKYQSKNIKTTILFLLGLIALGALILAIFWEKLT